MTVGGTVAGEVDSDAVLLRVTLTFCAPLVVALAPQEAGALQLQRSPTRVFAGSLASRPELPVADQGQI